MNYGKEGDDYEAYERDISVIHFYFDSSTAFQYYREPRMTLTTFISQIGGVLGLFLGFSIVSLVELLYWFLYRLCYLLFNPKRKASKASHSRYKKRPFDLKYYLSENKSTLNFTHLIITFPFYNYIPVLPLHSHITITFPYHHYIPIS